MKYVGNFKEWIPDGLIEYLDSQEGVPVPIWDEKKLSSHPDLIKYRELARPGYENGDQVYHRFIQQDMPDMQLPPLDLPKKRKNTFWWIVKLKPGEMQNIHIDQFLCDAENPVRYSMFLQDWTLGHTFVYEDKMIGGYKAGDLYEWTDPMVEHGAINLGFNNRYTMQISCHDATNWPKDLK